MQDFWRFWGNEIISPTVFPAACAVYAPILHRHTAHCSSSGDIIDSAMAAILQQKRLKLKRKQRLRNFVPMVVMRTNKFTHMRMIVIDSCVIFVFI